MTDKHVVFGFAAAWCVAIATGAVMMQETEPQPDWDERAWSEHLAQELGGEHQSVMIDRSIADIITDSAACEVEWSDHKGESVYQALSYMLEANSDEAVIILLCRGDYQKDRLQLSRVVAYLQGHGVPIRMKSVKVPR